MKSMNDRKLDMMRGKPMSEGYFPEDPHYESLMSPGEIKVPMYPDTEEEIYMNQNQAVKASDKGSLAAGYRH